MQKAISVNEMSSRSALDTAARSMLDTQELNKLLEDGWVIKSITKTRICGGEDFRISPLLVIVEKIGT